MEFKRHLLGESTRCTESLSSDYGTNRKFHILLKLKGQDSLALGLLDVCVLILIKPGTVKPQYVLTELWEESRAPSSWMRTMPPSFNAHTDA